MAATGAAREPFVKTRLPPIESGMDGALYNAEILRLAASIPHGRRIDTPDASVRRSSPICGSRVTVDITVDPAGRVTGFAQEVRACALGQASAAILATGIVGQDHASLADAHSALTAWLKGSGPLPPILSIHFPRLSLMEPARAHPGRHASIALAFAAAAEAAAEAAARRQAA